jgi:uncharacterized membrane protein YebE (DUF533 family)
MAKERLGRDVFIALAAVGWADGKLDGEEADAIVRTALEEGLELPEIAQIEQATKEPVELGSLDKDALSREDRLFVYAVASWMTRLDGHVSEKELLAMVKLGDALGIPPGSRQVADSIAQDVALLPDGDRPLRYDLPKLRTIIADRLEESARRKTAKS